MKNNTLALVFSILCMMSSSSFAHWNEFHPDLFSLADFPQEGSKEYANDFKILHHLQNTRTQETCDLASKQNKFTFKNLFSKHSRLISENEADTLKPLFKQIFEFTEEATDYFKEKYQRPRPFVEDETLHPCIEKPTGKRAYPSGHSVAGALGACILKEIFPKRAEKLVRYGKSIGYNRVVVGVHHMSDVEAGWNLADQMCHYLLENNSFKRELREYSKAL